MNGILLLDKPSGFTSHDCVAKLRSILRERRIGHSGTLDPMATGLLVVFIGRATRAVMFAESFDKEYIAGLRLGVVTDTQDVTGGVLLKSAQSVSADTLSDALSSFTGDIEQIPPMFSAIKIGGKKLYEIARQGGEVERAPRKIRVSELSLLSLDGQDALLRVRCSKGTYVRTLCHDIGALLGTGGCMSSLRRTRAGDFSVERAKSFEEIEAAVKAGHADELLIPVDALFSKLPPAVIDAGRERKCRCGSSFPLDAADGDYRVYSASGEFLALGRVSGGVASTVRSFFEV